MSSTEHLSELTLDALAIDALPGSTRDRALVHLATCARCDARVRVAQQLRDQLPPQVMARTLAAIDPRGGRNRLAGPLARVAAPLALVAAILVVVVRLRGGAAPIGDGLAIKGGPALQIYAQRDREVFEVTDGMTLAAGDEIRFAVTPSGATHVLIGSVDGRGHATVYVPYGGAESIAVDPRARTELEGSIVLDDAPGPERVVAVFSAAPVRAADVEAELRALAVGGVGRLRDPHPHPLAIAATQASLVFEKAPGQESGPK